MRPSWHYITPVPPVDCDGVDLRRRTIFLTKTSPCSEYASIWTPQRAPEQWKRALNAHIIWDYLSLVGKDPLQYIKLLCSGKCKANYVNDTRPCMVKQLSPSCPFLKQCLKYLLCSCLRSLRLPLWGWLWAKALEAEGNCSSAIQRTTGLSKCLKFLQIEMKKLKTTLSDKGRGVTYDHRMRSLTTTDTRKGFWVTYDHKVRSLTTTEPHIHWQGQQIHHSAWGHLWPQNAVTYDHKTLSGFGVSGWGHDSIPASWAPECPPPEGFGVSGFRGGVMIACIPASWAPECPPAEGFGVPGFRGFGVGPG